MSHTRSNLVARTSSAGNPVTFNVTPGITDTVIVLLMNVIGGTVRAGGAPTFDGMPMRQADTQRIDVTSPEASCEIWYLDARHGLPLPVRSYSISIPNTGAQTIKYTVEAGQADGAKASGVPTGAKTLFQNASGANATGTNPTPGTLTIFEPGMIAWAIVASGADTWAPSAQGGTVIANTDDGTTGGGEQYSVSPAIGTLTLNWTFATSEDYGAIAALFKEVPELNFNGRMHVDCPSAGIISVTEKYGFR